MLFAFSQESLHGGFPCFQVPVGGAVDNLHPVRFPVKIDPVSCWAATAAHHWLHLLPVALVEQSIHSWVDSGVENDQCVDKCMSCITKGECGNIKDQDIVNTFSQPTYCKDGTDSYDHQSDSLPYLHHTLGSV